MYIHKSVDKEKQLKKQVLNINSNSSNPKLKQNIKNFRHVVTYSIKIKATC